MTDAALPDPHDPPEPTAAGEGRARAGDEEDDVLAALDARLASHPPEDFPVQHATDQFHRGGVLARAGRLAEAERALVAAAALFKGRLRREFGTALVALGSVLREQGRRSAAVAAFERAVKVLDGDDHPLEHGAAAFDLGLALREQGSTEAALDAFLRAREHLDPERAPRQAAAAAREVGVTLWQLGRADEAIPLLQEATRTLQRSGDAQAMGGAANALGLALLAAERPDDAVEALRTAVAGHPRSIRPPEYAMAKANLALAQEAVGAARLARMAARQALAVDGVPAPVRTQALDVLERVDGAGPGCGDLIHALEDEETEAWPVLVREELARWADLDDATLVAELDVVASELADRASGAVEVAEALLGGVLELPPEAMRRLVRGLVGATDRSTDPEAVHRALDRGMARFHVPQWMRLQQTFEAASNGADTWS